MWCMRSSRAYQYVPLLLIGSDLANGVRGKQELPNVQRHIHGAFARGCYSCYSYAWNSCIWRVLCSESVWGDYYFVSAVFQDSLERPEMSCVPGTNRGWALSIHMDHASLCRRPGHLAYFDETVVDSLMRRKYRAL